MKNVMHFIIRNRFQISAALYVVADLVLQMRLEPKPQRAKKPLTRQS